MTYKIHNIHLCNIYSSAEIGDGTNIGSFTEIGDRVKIGEKCKIGAFVFIPKGVTIQNEVFIGPKVAFTNDKYPKATGEWSIRPTLVCNGASIGANCTIVCGVMIGEGARIGAGSVVTRDVPAGETYYGNPARSVQEWEKRKGLENLSK